MAGQKLDRGVYFSLLANRLDWMLRREEDPESSLDNLIQILDRGPPRQNLEALVVNPILVGLVSFVVSG